MATTELTERRSMIQDSRASEAVYTPVPLEKITVPEGRRRVDETRVAALAASIADVELLQPVALTSDYRLIFGAHRLAAYRRLGRLVIPASIHDLDDLHLELAEIDENIQRSTLTALETSKALARRKEIYEALHPDTRPVTKRGGPGRGKKTSDKMSPVSFTEDTAAKVGKHHRTIQRMVEIGKGLDDEAAKLLADTPLANKQSELKQLSKLPSDIQRQVAEKLVGGQARTVAAAITTPAPATVAPAPDPAANAVQRGLKGLAAVVVALKACGIHDSHQSAVQAIKQALEQHAAVEAHDGELVVKGPKRAKAIAMKPIEHKAAVPAALDAAKAKSITTRGQMPRETVVQCEPESHGADESQDTDCKTITVSNKVFKVKQVFGTWYYQLDGRPEDVWTECRPEFVKLIKESNGIAVHGIRPTR
jgi:ParB family chromosome partitioning protein